MLPYLFFKARHALNPTQGLDGGSVKGDIDRAPLKKVDIDSVTGDIDRAPLKGISIYIYMYICRDVEVDVDIRTRVLLIKWSFKIRSGSA